MCLNATVLNLLLGQNCINRIGILTTKATATVFIKIMLMSKYQHVLFLECSQAHLDQEL